MWGRIGFSQGQIHIWPESAGIETDGERWPWLGGNRAESLRHPTSPPAQFLYSHTLFSPEEEEVALGPSSFASGPSPGDGIRRPKAGLASLFPCSSSLTRRVPSAPRCPGELFWSRVPKRRECSFRLGTSQYLWHVSCFTSRVDMRELVSLEQGTKDSLGPSQPEPVPEGSCCTGGRGGSQGLVPNLWL